MSVHFRERESLIVESFVDFKTELKARFDVLKRVDQLHHLDQLHELPEQKNTRSRRNVKADREAPDDYVLKTPEGVLQKTKNPLAFSNVSFNFRGTHMYASCKWQCF